MTPDSTLPERRLMQSVILIALADACGAGSDGRSAATVEHDKRAAIAWFREAGPDFQRVCELAGLFPDTVRKEALAFIASGEPFPRLNRAQHTRRRNPFSPAAIAARAGVSESAARNVLRKDRGSGDLKMRVRTAWREITEQESRAA